MLIERAIKHHKIDVVSLDPFIKSHGFDENSNNAIDFVCTLLAKIAIDRDCAVDLPHHTNKQVSRGPGDADRGRGASSMKDAARLVYTLNPMTTEEAEQFNLSEADRRSLIRMDSGKVNIAPPSHEATWFRLIGVPLYNGHGVYLAGDNVQTVERWYPPKTWEGLDSALLNRILDDIEAGCPGGTSRYSTAASAKDRAAGEWSSNMHPIRPRNRPGKSSRHGSNPAPSSSKNTPIPQPGNNTRGCGSTRIFVPLDLRT